jgi:hypothetical protein
MEGGHKFGELPNARLFDELKSAYVAKLTEITIQHNEMKIDALRSRIESMTVAKPEFCIVMLYRPP